MRAFFDYAQEQQIFKDIAYEVLNAVLYGTISALVRRQVYGELEVSEAMLEQAVDACWDAVKR